MDPERAQAIAERLHMDDAALLEHVRRVAAAVPGDAVAVAWLHEALERTAVSEHELLIAGLESDELRALRLLTRPNAPSLPHLDLIAHAAGRSGWLARVVRHADLEDRVAYGATPARAL
jgi:hypothetical protein